MHIGWPSDDVRKRYAPIPTPTRCQNAGPVTCSVTRFATNPPESSGTIIMWSGQLGILTLSSGSPSAARHRMARPFTTISLYPVTTISSSEVSCSLVAPVWAATGKPPTQRAIVAVTNGRRASSMRPPLHLSPASPHRSSRGLGSCAVRARSKAAPARKTAASAHFAPIKLRPTGNPWTAPIGTDKCG